jgi:hypothetical protein
MQTNRTWSECSLHNYFRFASVKPNMSRKPYTASNSSCGPMPLSDSLLCKGVLNILKRSKPFMPSLAFLSLAATLRLHTSLLLLVFDVHSLALSSPLTFLPLLFPEYWNYCCCGDLAFLLASMLLLALFRLCHPFLFLVSLMLLEYLLLLASCNCWHPRCCWRSRCS